MGDAFMRNNQDLQARTKQQNRSNVLQLKLIGQSHPTGLTNNLLKLFEARPPLEFKAPPEKRKCPPYTGMAQFVSNFAEKGDPEYQPPVLKGETPAQKKARIHNIRLEEGARKAAEELEKYDPHHNPDATGDPYKTLFVSRLNYETSESKIKREFEAYGPIKRVRLVADKLTSKPRGYAFIEYIHTRDMKAAYKQGDGRKIDGRRVLVDVERGRTVPNWRPRRLGGGLGTSRISTEDNNPKVSGRESGRPSKSEEPRMREDRHADREKSLEKEREREREREKSRERSKDRPRDRDHREDRHHRDRERTRDSERTREKERERESRRDRDRARDHDRGRDHGRDRDRERDRPRERERDKKRDYEVGEFDHDRGHSRDKDYDHVDSKYDRDRYRDRDHEDHEYYDRDRGRGHYGDFGNQGDQDDYDLIDRPRAHDRYDQMEYDDHYDRAASEHHEKESTPDMDQEYE